MDNSIYGINLYPVDRYYVMHLRYALDRDLSLKYCYPSFDQLGPDLLITGYEIKRAQTGDIPSLTRVIFAVLISGLHSCHEAAG